MSRIHLLSLLLGAIVTSAGCGSDKPVRKEPNLSDMAASPRHDYTSTWVYAVGEVDAPAVGDCSKALKFAEGEENCVDAGCKYGANLVKDFEFGCRNVATAEQHRRANELKSTFVSRAAKPPTECVQQIDGWLERGCGRDGACEPQIQQWATQCLEEVKSPLALHLLERLVENSLREGRRVKFDVRSCDEYKKKLEEAANCSKQFDCEDAMPRIDEYLERCARGKRKGIPLAQALHVARIRMGAEKPFEPIALSESRSKTSSLPGLLALAAGGGAVIKICSESVTDLPAYLEQRKKCSNGELTLFSVVDTAEGSKLEIQSLWHESDTTFARAHSKLVVEGETDVREAKLVEEVAASLGNLPKATDLTGAFERANLAYGSLSPALRQNEKLYRTLAAEDAALVTLFGLIGEQKARLFGRRLNDRELLGLWRRTEKLVFADVSRKGGIDIGKSCELGELMLEQALPLAFAAYRQKLTNAKLLVEKRKLAAHEDATAVRETLMTFTRACSAARAQIGAVQKEVERCAAAVDACSTEERGQLALKLDAARSDWRAARVQEIQTKVALGQPETPSAVCMNW